MGLLLREGPDEFSVEPVIALRTKDLVGRITVNAVFFIYISPDNESRLYRHL